MLEDNSSRQSGTNRDCFSQRYGREDFQATGAESEKPRSWQKTSTSNLDLTTHPTGSNFEDLLQNRPMIGAT